MMLLGCGMMLLGCGRDGTGLGHATTASAAAAAAVASGFFHGTRTMLAMTAAAHKINTVSAQNVFVRLGWVDGAGPTGRNNTPALVKTSRRAVDRTEKLRLPPSAPGFCGLVVNDRETCCWKRVNCHVEESNATFEKRKNSFFSSLFTPKPETCWSVR